MKQFEKPYLEMILLKGDVIVTSGIESEKGNDQGEQSDEW